MVSWQTCCRPKELGGLGILGISDLKLASFALQTCWLWLQKTDQDRAWSQLPIKTSKEVQAFFRASTFTKLGDSSTTLFWENQSIDGDDVATIAPYLHQCISMRTRRSLMVREALQDRRWVRCVIGRLSVLEITDYMHLWAVIEGTQLSQEPDKTVWRWTTDRCYTSKSAYTMMHSGSVKMAENVGSSTCEDFPLARHEEKTLDRGPKSETRTRGSGALLPMRPGPRNNRPHHRSMPIHP